jgi:hypothetical protein
MKVALALSGQPRFYDITYKNFFCNLIDNFQADVFFHTWWSMDMVGSLYPCASHAKDRLEDKDLFIHDNIPEVLQELYQPVDFLFEDYSIFKKHNLYYNPQYYSQWAVKELIKGRKKKYDLVIRSRFDLMCTQDITFLYDDNLWVPSCCPYTDRVNDMFSISNQDIFNKISDTYLNLEEFSFKNYFHSLMEWALIKQIEKENISVKTFPADYSSFDILRSDTAKFFL